MRYPMGRVLHSRRRLRLGGMPSQSSTLPHRVDQLLLGHRSFSGQRYHQRHAVDRQHMGVPYRLRDSMVLAFPPLRKRPIHSETVNKQLTRSQAIMWFAPESPWWLVRHGKLAEAEKSIQRLASKEMKPRAKPGTSSISSNSPTSAKPLLSGWVWAITLCCSV